MNKNSKLNLLLASDKVQLAIVELTTILNIMITESKISNFDIDSWLREWIMLPSPALGNSCPIESINSGNNLESIKYLMYCMLYGAYA